MASFVESASKAGEILRERLFVTEIQFSGEFQHDSVPESHKKAFSTLKHLLEHTIVRGEGNSLLVIGPRGVGKSWLVKQVFESLNSDSKCRNNFLKVELNGLVHTDDRLALQEIARQLDVSEELGEKMSLSFAAALNYLLEALRQGSHVNQSIVFILDEFDLFAHHKNQTLLYNLFDMAQTALNPIAVIGLTCRLDVIELLEKRVKSRFSHRQVTLFCDYQFDDFLRMFRSLLCLPEDFPDPLYSQQWKQHVEKLCQNSTVREALRHTYNISPAVGNLKSFLVLPVCKLGLQRAFLEPADFFQASSLRQRESTSAMLRGVTILELCLIIAMKHLIEVSDGEPFNFEMVYNEYKKFTQKSHSVEFFSKPVAMKAFEHLVSLEFVSPADSGAGKVQKEYQLMLLMLEEKQIARAVQQYPNCPTDVARWSTSKALV